MPSEDSRPRGVIGIGASAGGVEALQSFFKNVEPSNGYAFVVVTHRGEGRSSVLGDILRHHGTLEVVDVEAWVDLRPNTVYVSGSGSAQLVVGPDATVGPDGEIGAVAGPVDRCFMSISAHWGPRGAGVVLSGGGHDGTAGAQAIRREGGLVLVQQPEEAVHDSMPHSIIARSLADFVGPVSSLPGWITEHLDQNRELGTTGSEPEHLQPIFDLLLAERGVDFSAYKKSTLGRRIRRRMNVLGVSTLADYHRALEDTPAEVDALYHEVLIGVSRFFRDPEVWDRLYESVLIPGVANLGRRESYRVWIPGCSTGEEAFTVAILLQEAMDENGRHGNVQIFATDIDEGAIAFARAGAYAGAIADDVSEARLAKYFVEADGIHRVRDSVRETVIFAVHDVTRDPPFTRLDLLSCRNLLIYFDSNLQGQVLPIFHYALNPGGAMVLGTSESLGSASPLFDSIDRGLRIFRRRDVPNAAPFRPQSAASGRETVSRQRLSVMNGWNQETSPAERVLLDYTPPSVMCDADGHVIYVQGRTGAFLEPAPGVQSQANILDMAREGLRIELTSMLHELEEGGHVAVRRHVRIAAPDAGPEDEWLRVLVTAQVVSGHPGFDGCRLIQFHKLGPDRTEETDDAEPSVDRIIRLEEMLRSARGSHQQMLQDYASTNEELKSANEELQSMNEELQAANEELETSKEEMQSLNEELQTVNSELNGKVEELSRAHDDIKNLLNGTEIATIFLDSELRIQRYTEKAKRLASLIPSDCGRYVGDLVMRVDSDIVLQTSRAVMDDLVPREVEMRESAGAWYLLRVHPYRTERNVIDGIVLTFVDITSLKRLRELESRIDGSLGNSGVSVWEQDPDGKFRWAVGEVFGCRGPSVADKEEKDVLPKEPRQALARLRKSALDNGGAVTEVLEVPNADSVRRVRLTVAPSTTSDGVGTTTAAIWMDDQRVKQ